MGAKASHVDSCLGGVFTICCDFICTALSSLPDASGAPPLVVDFDDDKENRLEWKIGSFGRDFIRDDFLVYEVLALSDSFVL